MSIRKMFFLSVTLYHVGFVLAADQQHDQPLQKTTERCDSRSQVYGIPTYDALFKYVLSHKDIQPSFFRAVLPGLNVKSIQQLDKHMNPLISFQVLREMFSGKNVQEVLSQMRKAQAVSVHTHGEDEEQLTVNDSATEFLKSIVEHFDDFKKAIPKKEYDGTMDFVCELEKEERDSSGKVKISREFALVEMQVVPQNYSDHRALAYAAAFYGNQLRTGDKWSQLKKVIGINILGGGKESLPHWADTPDQFIRRYKFQEQEHQPIVRMIDGIELIQYSLMNAPVDIQQLELQDWICFLKEAHHMTEKEVEEKITTGEVKSAFQYAKLKDLPAQVKREYEAQDKEFDRFSHHTDQIAQESLKEGIEKGKEEGKFEVVKKMIAKNMSIEDIADLTDLKIEKIDDIRTSMHHATDDSDDTLPAKVARKENHSAA
ncbi:MAG: Rpn family recombination-promoting nuclease/putative transposase [Alphaproteobacteria bacterium]|nr:Rpn family recombination-promoting nuclease/putative transposase [Alphaproteobacteria bacterium]